MDTSSKQIVQTYRRKLLERGVELKQTRTELAKRTKLLETQNQELRTLSARLLCAEDQERRRISRELHDSLGQKLVLLAFDLGKVRTMAQGGNAGVGEAISNIHEDVKSIGTEIRTISYLLHPPLLDEMGLLAALRCYVDGFQERSKIGVSLRLPNQMKRLPQGLEITIFRIAQECLTNVYRHSGSMTASLELRCIPGGGLSMVISDRGRGIPPQKVRQIAGRSSSGVGLRGIEERARLYGGYLEIRSGRSGTAVRIMIPSVAETTDG